MTYALSQFLSRALYEGLSERRVEREKRGGGGGGGEGEGEGEGVQ